MDIVDYLSRLPIFKNLEADAARALAAATETAALPAGAVLFRQGDPGDAFYILTSGRLKIGVRAADGDETPVRELEPGECVGEMALLTGRPRTATVTAIEDCELLRLSKTAFDTLARSFPRLLSGLTAQLLPRYQQVQASQVLTRLFGRLEEADWAELLGGMGWRRLDSGQTLFRQGDPGEEMYVVVQGRLRFTRESGGARRVLGEVGAGECLGEFALLAEPGSPERLRSATVEAVRSTDVIVITRPIFENLLCRHPQALLNLTRQIVKRATAVGRPAAAGGHNLVITLLPAEPGVPLADFAARLAEALGALGPTLRLDAGRFDHLFGKAGASSAPLDHPLSLVIEEWLDERERGHKYLIHDGSPGIDASGVLTPWARRGAGDADIILVVGDGGADPRRSGVEKALDAMTSRPRLELALRHPEGSGVPSGSAAWLAARAASPFPAQACHHVRLDEPADFRRLARRLAGKPVGLTLAGGGARGWAHVGVLRAMEEDGLEFDWVAGASMGAIVAAGCALGWTSARMTELAARFSDPKKLLDLTFPYASFTSTKKVTSLLRRHFGEAGIEDAWKPFFCVSADLSHGTERLHTSGPLWEAVRASMAFPGVFAPVAKDGCLLIDGGAANNLPIDRMREMCPTGTVIGVDIDAGSPVRGRYDFGPSLSGWRALWSRLSPLNRKAAPPHLFSIVTGIVLSTTRYRLNEIWRNADLLVRVNVEDYGLLEFNKYAPIIEAGYRAAREQMKGFRPAV